MPLCVCVCVCIEVSTRIHVHLEVVPIMDSFKTVSISTLYNTVYKSQNYELIMGLKVMKTLEHQETNLTYRI